AECPVMTMGPALALLVPALLVLTPGSSCDPPGAGPAATARAACRSPQPARASTAHNKVSKLTRPRQVSWRGIGFGSLIRLSCESLTDCMRADHRTARVHTKKSGAASITETGLLAARSAPTWAAGLRVISRRWDR